MVLEGIALLLLLVEAVGERRAARWTREMEDADEFGESFNQWIWGHKAGRMWWRFDRAHWGLRLGVWLASLIARFDGWKEQHGLNDAFFFLAVALGVAGIGLTAVF